MTPILVLVSVVLLIIIGYIYQRTVLAPRKILPPQAVRELSFSDFRLPKGIFYDPHHTWVSIMPQGNVRIGIDDFLLKLTGSIHSIQVPQMGDETIRGNSLVTLIVGSKSFQMGAPLSGKVVAVNDDVVNDLSSILSGPLASKWIIELVPSRLSKEINQLTVAEKAGDWFRAEIERFKEFLIGQSTRPALAGATLPDGGAPVVGVLGLLDSDGITQFKQDFLSD
jgi:glycine cleavage system H lipoate-binding protein